VSATYSGLLGADTSIVGVTCSVSGYNAGSPAGSYATTCTGPAATADYSNITYVNGSLAVAASAATVTVTASSPSAISYGDGAPTVSATYSGLLGADTSIVGVTCSVSGYSAGSPVGSYTTTCSGPSSTSNYLNISYVNGSVNVTPVPLTITASSGSSIYGSTPGAITPTYVGLVNGDQAPAVLPTCTTTATSSSSVGNYATSCSGASDPNYTVTYVNGHEVVNPATLSVTANDATRIYHLGNPTFTTSFAGFVNGENSLVVSGSASCTTTANYASEVGTYPISCTNGTLRAENYVFTFAAGSLSVTPMPTVLRITSSPTLLDGSVTVKASLTESIGGAAIPGETVTFTVGSLSGTGTSNPAAATFTLANGVYNAGAVFAGDHNYLASSAADQTLYAYQATNFVVWGANHGGINLGMDLNFWGSQWAKQVVAGNYSAGASFKGYASVLNSAALTWLASPGNSSAPPATISQYIAVIVTTNATKSGNKISGNIDKVVILKVDNPSGYANDPGHPASGVVQTIVG
jgi:hypothetical protein